MTSQSVKMVDKTSPTVPVRVKGRFTSMKTINRLSNLGNQTKKYHRGAIYKRAKSNRHRILQVDSSACGKELHF